MAQNRLIFCIEMYFDPMIHIHQSECKNMEDWIFYSFFKNEIFACNHEVLHFCSDRVSDYVV